MPIKILIMAGSLRTGSHNARLAALAAKELTLADADVTAISLADYPLPLFDADIAGGGPPAKKNPWYWIAGGRGRGEPSYAAFKGRVFALGSATPGGGGGI